MTHLAHVLRTDVRQFRWAILLWTVLVAGDAALMAAQPSLAADLRVYSNAAMLANLLWWALQLGMLVLVPLIVQAHPAVGTDAFWMTRPIPARTVFAAKAVLLGVSMVLLFSVARLALMLWIRVPAREAMFVTLDTAIVSTAWLALLVAGAAITLNLPRFALLCVGVVVSLFILLTLLIMRAQFDDTEAVEATLAVGSVGGVGQPTLPPAEDPTQAVLFLLSVAVAGFGLAALQYGTRRRLVSMPIAGGGLALALVAIPYWPVPLLRIRTEVPAWTSRADALRLRAESSTIQLSPEVAWFGSPEIPRQGTTPVTATGIEQGWAPQLQLLGASLALDNGTVLKSRRGFQSAPRMEGTSDAVATVVARGVLGVPRVIGTPAMRPEESVILAVPRAAVSGSAELRGHYRGDFAVRLSLWEVVAALPLRRGSDFRDDAYRFTIEDVVAGPGSTLSVRAREWRATSSFDRKPAISYAFYVRNAGRTHAMEGRESEPFGGMQGYIPGLPFAFSGGGPSRFFLRAAVVSFPVPYGPQQENNDWNPEWYGDAELVLIRITDRGSVARTLDIPAATLVTKK